jgi:hypothetical protein
MIILDIILLCSLILLIYFKQEEEKEKEKKVKKEEKKKVVCYKKNNKIEIIENLEIINNNNNNNNNKLSEKLNDYNIEVDRPVFSCSNYKNDKIIDFNNINEELINIAYDKIVDDNRIQDVDYNNMSYYNSNDNYYDIQNTDNYGYTDFMTYKN